MKDTLPRNKLGNTASVPCRITVTYLIVGGLWILLSDKLVELLVTDPRIITQIAILKGWLYVGGTGLMLYALIARGVSQIRRSEEEARQTEVRYRELVESANSIIMRRDISGRITFFNEFAQGFFGYWEDEILGRNVVGTIVPEADGSGRNLKAMVEDIGRHPERYASNENENMRRNGERVWIAWTNKPIRDDDGQITEILCVGNDITERKRTEEALRLYELLVSHSRDIILFLRRHDGRILEANEAAVTAYGYDREQLLTMTIQQLRVPESLGLISDQLAEADRQGLLFETVHCRRDGSAFPVEVSSRGETVGGVRALISVIRDITERKRAEAARKTLRERLHRAEKMEALGTLAGGVAHDLNNVLGIVVGYSELLLNDLNEPSSARSEALQILKGGQRAAAIVQDLLTLARRGVPNRQVLNLNDIIMEWQHSPESARLHSSHPDIVIKVELEPDLLNISGSSVHLAKSVYNLVANAVEAMPKGGALTIKTRNQYLEKPVSGYDEVKEGDYVVLSLSDTGEGISASELKCIFEPFYTKKVMGRSGTGLGLAVVWGTMKDHFGYINVESEEGKGTTFTLYFPVTREELAPEEVSISAAEYMGNRERILVVDDVNEQRELAERMLGRLNYTVSGVRSGEEAVEFIKHHEVDLVVLDMIMDPGMDGLDTYRKMVEFHPRQRAIIVSGFAETERVIRAQSLGAGAYVKKPYVLEKLGLAVRKELDKPA